MESAATLCTCDLLLRDALINRIVPKVGISEKFKDYDLFQRQCKITLRSKYNRRRNIRHSSGPVVENTEQLNKSAAHIADISKHPNIQY
jgi:hypothetical protein